MSRTISASNLAEIDAAHLHEVLLVKLEFDTPVYIHSGVGSIVFDSNTYLGVGQFGNVGNQIESEQLRPTSLILSLSGVDAALITEALDAGNYGDIITIYMGYRQDDGTLVDDPWIPWKGFFEFAAVKHGTENIVSITCRHDLAILNEAEGSRFSDEDQQVRFTGDTGFQYITDMAGTKLIWGGGRVSTGSTGGRGSENDRRDERRQ